MTDTRIRIKAYSTSVWPASSSRILCGSLIGIVVTRTSGRLPGLRRRVPTCRIDRGASHDRLDSVS